MKHFIFSFLSLIILCSGSRPTIGNRQAVIYDIVHQFAKMMKKEGFELCAIGGSAKEKKSSYIDMLFQADRVLNIECGRELIVKVVNDFLSFLNSRNNIEKYLIEYPFPRSKLSIGIMSKEIFPNDPQYLVVAAKAGKIIYYTRNPDTGMGLITIHEESFEEAERIVQSKSISHITS